MVTLYRFAKELEPSVHPVLATVRRFAPIGERGVDLFFVLSGFLITGILIQTKNQHGYFGNFFVRRSLRIFPLYFAALAICVWLIPLLASPSPFDLAQAEQGYLWTYLTNVRMSFLNQWCFGPLDHFWSLAVEEHFYLIWPFIVICFSLKSLLRLAISLIAIVGIARIFCAMNPNCDVAVDVLTIFRCDSLFFGAVLAILISQGVSTRSVERLSKWTLPFMLILAFSMVVLGSRALALPSTLCPAIWTVLLGLLITRPKGHWLSRIARCGVLRWLGKYSYGMYVVQLPLVSIITINLYTTVILPHSSNMLLVQLSYIPTMLATTMLLGFLSYHGLEKHFLRLKRRWN
jgi:peptidoglycan/LPS O-acetylase OafA/YrhL